MENYNGIRTFRAKTRKDWRKWLKKNHQSEKSVWLVIYKKGSETPSVYYPEAVDEALCFGWIDSKANKRDEHSYYQFFAKRNPKNNWSKVNKQKVAKLIEQGLMHTAGFEMIEIAKRNGTWTALDKVEELTIPDDLLELFANNKTAFGNWENFHVHQKGGYLNG